MPGHGKSLLAALYISGDYRKCVLPLAFAYSLSHGIMMALAAVAGIAFGETMVNWSSNHGLIVRNAYLPILAALGVFYAWKAIRKASTQDVPVKIISSVSGRPWAAGFLVGLIPCSDLLGLAAISPMLVTTRENLIGAALVVWLGIITTVMAVALGLRFLPVDRATHRMPGWVPCAVASLLCFVVLVYRVRILWRDILFLY